MSKSNAEISSFIVKTLSEILDVSESAINSDLEFDSYGLSSSAAVGLLGEVEEFVDHDLSPSILFKHNTVNKLTAYLSVLTNVDETAENVI